MSQSTLAELQDLPLRLPAHQVIYEGIEDFFWQPVTTADRQKVRMFLGTPDPYLVHVGVWMSHKNLPRLVEAYAQAVERYPRLKLVLTGKPKPGYSNVLKIARQLGVLDHVHFTGFVPPHLLPALYAEARCLVFPSLYEGFGLPPLEAMAVGTPVIASQVTSLPELLGDAALLVNPEYVPSITQAILTCLKDEKIRLELCKRGRAQAARFQWPTAAAAHWQLYQQVAQKEAAKV